MTNDDEELMSASDAAAYLGLIRQRIYALALTGRIGRRVGGYWLFSKAELDQYDRERKARPQGGALKGERGKKELSSAAL